MEALFPLIITFGLMWVLLIRPQQRRVRQHQSVVASLIEGDEVVTTGGLIGTVEEINEDVLTVEVAPGVSVRMLRSAVQTRIGGPDEIEPDEIEPDEIDSGEVEPDEIDSGEVEPDEIDEEPALPEIETPAVDALPPASTGELPPAGPVSGGPVAGGPGTQPADPVADDLPPRRPDGGNGV